MLPSVLKSYLFEAKMRVLYMLKRGSKHCFCQLRIIKSMIPSIDNCENVIKERFATSVGKFAKTSKSVCDQTLV